MKPNQTLIGWLLCWLGFHKWSIYPTFKYCYRCRIKRESQQTDFEKEKQ